MKQIAPLSVYLVVGIGLLIFHSAWGALLGFHAIVILSLLIAKPNIPVKMLFTGTNIKWIILSVLLCGSSGVTLYLLWDHFGIANDFSAQIASMGLNQSNWFLFILYFTLVNPLIEEYFWRGYLGNKTKTPHTSDFLYAGYHASILFGKMQTASILFGIISLVLAGWFWRQIMREDQGLLAAVLGHMAADFTILLAVYRMTM